MLGKFLKNPFRKSSFATLLIPLEHSTVKWKGDENEYFLGYEMNWAAFHIVEIMASTKLRYLIFHDDTNSLLKPPKIQQSINS